MTERTIDIPSGADRITVFGAADRNIKMIREALGVAIGQRDAGLVIRGDEPAVSKAAAVLEHLAQSARGRRALSRDDVLNAIVHAPEVPNHDDTLDLSKSPAWTGSLNVQASGRPVRPKTPNQESYIEAIRTHDLVLAVGPAGSGKTYLSVATAVHLLRVGRVKRIVLARPAVEAGERLGFLPGDLQEKVNPYLRPLFDALEDMLDYSTLQRFIASGVIEIIPLAFMRGRTLNDAIMILDEAQNTTKSQMLMFLTRIGRSSKAIVTGDITQIDLNDPETSGLIDAVKRLRHVPGCSFVALNRTDIVRHAIVDRVVQAYADRSTDEKSRFDAAEAELEALTEETMADTTDEQGAGSVSRPYSERDQITTQTSETESNPAPQQTPEQA